VRVVSIWQHQDLKTLKRIDSLLQECQRDTFRGLGDNLTGWWSGRTDREHRLYYRISGNDDVQTLEVAQCRYHY